MKITLTKEEQKIFKDDIKYLKKDLNKLLIKYNFEYDGDGLDLIDGSYDIFYYYFE